MKKLMLGLLMAFAVTAEAAAYVDGFSYQFFMNDRTATILDYDRGNPPTKVDVAEVEREYYGKFIVTSVGVEAFTDCDSLKTVSLPNVTTIGDRAFKGCGSLTTVSLPNATTLGLTAFRSCDSLKTVSLPNATTIGDLAFFDCKSLSCLVVNDNMRSTLEANRGGYGIPQSTVIVTESRFLSREVVENAKYVVQNPEVDTNLSVVVSTDVKVQPSVTLKSDESVLDEADYETFCAIYGIIPQTKPETPEVPAEPTADDFKVVSKDAQVIGSDEIAVKKESIQAAKAEAVSIADGVVSLGVTVNTNGNFTAEAKSWAPVELTSDNVEVKDGKIVISIPVSDKSGFMILQSGDAKVGD